ncbi:MAG: serine hydrolase domain-containing protein [Alphaproteobacteria bacterium]|nr:serine hydrolase domain-containing protein [Alphaproteobacteria bacterium]
MLEQFRVAHARTWLAAGLASVLAACATAPGPDARAAQWPTRADVVATQTDFTPEGLAALDARLKEAVDKGQVSGLEYVLFKDGEVAAFNTFGTRSFGGAPLTEDTIFRIRSMTKVITGVALMQLYEQGKWQLDDPVTRYVPEFASLKVHTEDADKKVVLVNAARPATMRELFTHTAGFGYGLSANNAVDRMFIADHPMGKKDLKALVDRVAEIPLLAQPGERFSYSIGIDVQGAIIERLSGMTFGDYLEANIFTPLGMKDTGFVLDEADRARFATVYTRNPASGRMELFPDPADRDFFKADHAQSGGGGLASTLHDYARFARMLVSDGELDGQRILKPETLQLMMRNHLSGDLRGFGAGWGLGGQVQIESTERAPQPVGTFSWFGIDGTWFWADPVNDLGFVAMIQRRGGGGPGSVDLRGESPQLVYKALRK